MKKFFLLLLVFLFLYGCKKYEDGPSLSLRPKKWRLSGSWHVEQMLVNGQDMTSAYYPNHEYYESYEVGGSFTYTAGTSITSPTGTGAWRWIDHKKEILRTASLSSADGIITILKLENKSFWYFYQAGSSTYEMHMVQD